MILRAVFSRPAKNVSEVLGRPYVRVRLWRNAGAGLKAGAEYSAEFFTETQSFRKSMGSAEAEDFVALNAGKVFRSAVVTTEAEELTYLSNRHGEVKVLQKKLRAQDTSFLVPNTQNHNRIKNYILPEGVPVPFLVHLGVMAKDGKVNAKKYDKFRQINRFLEYVADILPELEKCGPFTERNPLCVIDFGSGKSYLTFALYHYLHEVKKIPVEITGLDLKAQVIAECSLLARNCGYSGLSFCVGDIAEYGKNKKPHLVVTLHACDTATDYALDYAASCGASAILSVPCCQHEVNAALSVKENASKVPAQFEPLLRYGIIRERFSALVTDAVRAELLENRGYSVQVLEFIDMAHTPKNILLRAVKKSGGAGNATDCGKSDGASCGSSGGRASSGGGASGTAGEAEGTKYAELLEALGVTPTLLKLTERTSE